MRNQPAHAQTETPEPARNTSAVHGSHQAVQAHLCVTQNCDAASRTEHPMATASSTARPSTTTSVLCTRNSCTGTRTVTGWPSRIEATVLSATTASRNEEHEERGIHAPKQYLNTCAVVLSEAKRHCPDAAVTHQLFDFATGGTGRVKETNHIDALRSIC